MGLKIRVFCVVVVKKEETKSVPCLSSVCSQSQGYSAVRCRYLLALRLHLRLELRRVSSLWERERHNMVLNESKICTEWEIMVGTWFG